MYVILFTAREVLPQTGSYSSETRMIQACRSWLQQPDSLCRVYAADGQEEIGQVDDWQRVSHQVYTILGLHDADNTIGDMWRSAFSVR